LTPKRHRLRLLREKGHLKALTKNTFDELLSIGGDLRSEFDHLAVDCSLLFLRVRTYSRVEGGTLHIS